MHDFLQSTNLPNGDLVESMIRGVNAMKELVGGGGLCGSTVRRLDDDGHASARSYLGLCLLVNAAERIFLTYG